MLYLEVDQHRKQLTVNLRNQQGEVALRRRVSTQWEQVRKFFKEIVALTRHAGWLDRLFLSDTRQATLARPV